ncbi:SEC14-like protein 2 [Glandiceps talaboti]
MSGRVGDLSPKQELALQKFKENIADVLEPRHDDHFVLKWLRARHWDLKKAEQMLRAALQYRKQMKTDELCRTWKDPEVLEKYFIGGLCGYDKQGCPIWLVPFGCVDPKGIIYSVKYSDVIKNTIILCEKIHEQFEEQTKKLGRRVDTAVAIFDLEHVTLNHIWKPFMDLYGQILNVFEANYPEGLKICFITRAPRLLSVGYNMAKPFLSDDTKKKVVILGNDFQNELLKHIDADQLPAHFGGTLKDPDGDPRYRTKVLYGGKIPESYYLKDKQLNTDGMQTTTVGRGATVDLDYTVEIPGTVISWGFQTEGSDVNFGIFKKDGGEKALTTIVPMSRCKSNIIVEDGQVKVDDPGTYVVRFDNSYSWVKSKKIKYAIQVLPPDKEMAALLNNGMPGVDPETNENVGEAL